MLSMNLIILNPLFGKCILIDPVLAAGAAVAPIHSFSAIFVDSTGKTFGILLP